MMGIDVICCHGGESTDRGEGASVEKLGAGSDDHMKKL